MTANDTISVIVPCYNVENYISNTIHSICTQTHQQLEIILVDDGSTDATSQILDTAALQDKRIRVIHKQNGGVTDARLTGVEAAAGEWIGFVDGDDIIEREMYEHLLKNAIEYGADISHCGYQMVFPDRVDYYYNTGRSVRQDNTTGLKDLLSGSFIEPGLCNKLFHRSLFRNLLHDGKMDLTIRELEDLLMNYYLFKEAKQSIYEDICPYHYVLRKGSACISEINEHKLCDGLKVFKIIKSDLEQDLLVNIIDQRIVWQLMRLASHSLESNEALIKRARKEARKELRNELPRIIKGQFSMKTKLFAVWCGLLPKFYSVVHAAYSKIRHTDQTYAVE